MLNESEIELLKTVDIEKLENCIDQIAAIDEIEWGGGPTGEKDSDGKEIIQWPYPKYPECVFDALRVLGSDKNYVATIKEIYKIDPVDLDLFQIRTLFTGIYRQERFCDGLIAGNIESGVILTCLKRILELKKNNNNTED